MSDQVVTVDVRDAIRQGREPFSNIMQAVDGLRGGEVLRLVAPFEPAPLYSVLGKRGFTHTSVQKESGDWEIVFTPTAAASPRGASQSEKPEVNVSSAAGKEEFVEVDARGLEPPQPLVKILESVSALSPGVGLRARTDRRPMHLYAHLEQRGYVAETQEQPDGTFLTIVTPR